MDATFTKAAVYSILAECKTPLRTGETTGDVERVLLDVNGTPMVQGSSISGALRGWLEAQDKDYAEQLFGSQERYGRLIVSDAHFNEDSEVSIRPRLRIDGSSGAADPGGKFDIAHVCAGSKLTFSVTWLGTGADEQKDLAALDQMLAAIQCGDIRLGAQKTNGFGRLSLQVRRSRYDMTDPEDLAAWLDDREVFAENDNPYVLPTTSSEKYVTFTLSGHMPSILVKAAGSEFGGERSYIGNLEEASGPILPGSSIKGPIRARVEAISRYMSISEETTDAIFGRESAEGDNGLAGQIQFEDVYLDSGKKIKISRIHINRLTGGVMRGGLFTEEPLASDVNLIVRVPLDCAVGCGLIFYALRDLALQLYPLGSGGAIGRGYLTASKLSISVPKQPLITVRFDGDRNMDIDDSEHTIALWLNALQEVKK